MQPRTTRIIIAIANDSGAAASYNLRPLPLADLGSSVAAFRLVNLTEPPHAVYTVRLDASGLTSCDCPQHARRQQCKHADALTATGVLPCALLGLLQERTKQLEAAEAQAQLLAEAAMEERSLHEHDAAWNADRIADLTATVAALNDRAARLQIEVAARQPAPPKRRRAAKAKAA